MWVWPGCAFNSCGFSSLPNTLSAAWRTDTQRQVSGQFGRGLRACPPHVQARGLPSPPRRAAPRALRLPVACSARCARGCLLPSPVPCPLCSPLTPASRFRPVSLRLLSEGGVAQDSRGRVIFPGGLRMGVGGGAAHAYRGLRGYPLVVCHREAWSLCSSHLGHPWSCGRKGRAGVGKAGPACCAARHPSPPSEKTTRLPGAPPRPLRSPPPTL